MIWGGNRLFHFTNHFYLHKTKQIQLGGNGTQTSEISHYFKVYLLTWKYVCFLNISSLKKSCIDKENQALPLKSMLLHCIYCVVKGWEVSRNLSGDTDSLSSSTSVLWWRQAAVLNEMKSEPRCVPPPVISYKLKRKTELNTSALNRLHKASLLHHWFPQSKQNQTKRRPSDFLAVAPASLRREAQSGDPSFLSVEERCALVRPTARLHVWLRFR